MAKQQLKNYVFKPGIGALDYVYPDAYDLLLRNKSFLLSESIAYINQEIIDATKCQRDIGYIIDGVSFDIALGTNYNSIFLGIAEANSLDLSNTVVRTINRTRFNVNALSAVSSSALALSRSNQFFDEVIDVINNGRSAANTLTLTNPTGADVNSIAAKDRLVNNKNFLAAEVNAWVAETYPSANHDPVKCARDVKYAIDALCYDILYGGNSATYDQAKFFFYGFASGSPGIDPTHRLQTVAAYNRLQTIVGQVVAGTSVTRSNGGTYPETQNTSGNNSNKAADLQTLVQITEDVVAATSQEDATTVLAGIVRTAPSVAWAASAVTTAKTAIASAKTTIINQVTWSPSYTYNQSKCERDLGYVLDAYLHDLRYGGNEYLRKTIKYYWEQDVAQVDGNRIPEIDTHAFIGDLITNYILANLQWDAQGLQSQVVDVTKTSETVYYTPTDATYNPVSGAMTLTIGTHSLTAGTKVIIAPNGITFTCELDNNATLHSYPRTASVSNATGNDPFYNKEITITSVTATSITLNVGISSDTSDHTFVSAVANSVITGAESKITTLVQNTVEVITNGLGSMPAAEDAGVSTVKVQGQWGTNELLLITNTSKSEIIYNFSSIATGGSVSIITRGSDSDFTKYLQTTDGVTTITLNYNTSSHSATDELQIFVEVPEVRTRPYDFGTDAIERNRMAAPQSMLDADFEYGLQPTKWSAIGVLRGYPSVYEVPGTDIGVISVVTDASVGTEGIGQSLITVTTAGAHGIVAGQPITIKALENAVVGAARAEGSFIVTTIPSVTTFTFYAKAKVGTAPGTVLSTTYTQLRKAGFYTGASIGAPTFTLVSNGSSGTLTAFLDVAVGSDIIPYDGDIPSLGAPLVNANIPTGSQVTAVIDNAGLGGIYTTPALTETINTGTNIATVADASGIVANLAVDRGDGTAIYVTSVVGNQIEFSGNFTSQLVANIKTFSNVAGANAVSIGFDATFDISIATGAYVLDAVAAGGESYEVGDRIIIAGNNLDGTAVINDLLIKVDTIGALGTIVTASIISGTPYDGIVAETGLTATYAGGVGDGVAFDVTYLNNAYTAVAVSTPDTSAGYVVGDVVVVAGSVINSVNGVDGTHDLYVLVTEVGVSGNVTAVEFAGTAPLWYKEYVSPTYTTTSVAGVGATFNVTLNGGSYSVSVTNLGNDYLPTETVTILGTSLGGLTPDNDLVITITGVNVTGGITTFTKTGTGINGIPTYINPAYTSTSLAGTASAFDVVISGSGYAVTVTTPGTNYLPTETITILGTNLGGATTANDLVITITGVDGTGGITEFTLAGTSNNSNLVLGSVGNNRIGTGVTFDVDMSSTVYSVTINNPGSGYGNGQELTISGLLLGGATPANDLTITISAIDELRFGVVTTIASSGTGRSAAVGPFLAVGGTNQNTTGTNARFNISKNYATYDSITLANTGTGYRPGNRIIIPGTSLSGTDPAHNITISILSILGSGDSGPINSFTSSYDVANYGATFDLITTITMSDQTTGIISETDSIAFEALATVLVTFPTAHGIVPGATFITSITSDNGSNNHNLIAGAYIASNVPNINEIEFQVRAPGTISPLNPIIGIVYPRPDSFFTHRPFDGGVQLGTGGPQHGAQAIRQSKKYIRYQSGKGIMYTTGALFAPSYDLRSVTSDGVEVGSTITVVTDDNDHGVQVGGIIRLLGIDTPGYSSGNETGTPPIFDYDVIDVDDERTFKIRAKRRLGSTTAVLGFGAQMSVVGWHGATVRSGIFDDQNGIFWEYDGTQISVVQRTGTFQVAGNVSINVDSNQIIGSNTRFREQLKAGDRVVIKGMTHVVSHVASNTSMTVTPDYRGVTNVSGVKIMLVTDKKTKQSDFNLDRLDGTGPSGYNLDPAKMQMIGIQYSWYGAGFIDFMLRGSNGNFVFAHRMRNSNINTEAFMRSGNLPVRYEVTNEGAISRLTASITSSQTTITVEDASFFPTEGTIYIDNEIITFNGITGNTLNSCIRGTTLTNFQAGASRSYSAGPAAAHDAGTGVILISNTITPLISHWGSAFLTDGGFDEDRGYIFNYAATNISVSTTKQTAFLIRLAPSVSNAIVGDLGERELLNRAQLLLQGIEITSNNATTAQDGGIVIDGVLNPQNYPINPADVGWSGLSGVAAGGQPSFAQVAAGGSVVWSTGVSATTADATSINTVSAQIDSNAFSSSGNNSDYVFINATDYRATFGTSNTDIIIGKTITGTGIPTNTTIREAYVDQSGTYGQIRLSNRTTQGIGTNVSNAFTIVYNTALVNRNFAYLTTASFNATAARVGTSVTGGSVTFPANTSVNRIRSITWAGQTFYEVQFNNNFSGTLALNTGTIQFTFVTPPFAQPGETVFSFIAKPGERSSLDLAQLKELTNTALGGRGVFPNGPDVLAVNIYKVTGDPIVANIVLRWGEAQA